MLKGQSSKVKMRGKSLTLPFRSSPRGLIGECFQDPDASEGNESQTGNPYDNGQYYVFLPDGKLQKVQYSGKQRGRFVLES